MPDHCLLTEWAGVASPRKRGFCASISSCLQEGLTDCCTSSRLSYPGVSVNQDFLILNGEVPTSFWHICLSWLSCSSNTKSRKEQCEALGNQAFKYLILESSNQETFDTMHPHLKPHSINFNLTPYKNIPTMSFCFVPEIETYILSYNNQLHPLKHLNPLEELSSLLPSPPIPIQVNFPRDMQSQIFPLAAVLVIFSHQAGKIIFLFPMFASKWLQLKMDDYNARLKSGGVESKKPHGRISALRSRRKESSGFWCEGAKDATGVGKSGQKSRDHGANTSGKPSRAIAWSWYFTAVYFRCQAQVG